MLNHDDLVESAWFRAITVVFEDFALWRSRLYQFNPSFSQVQTIYFEISGLSSNLLDTVVTTSDWQAIFVPLSIILIEAQRVFEINLSE